MAKTRELKHRIRSIENTKKITHAMELVAGAKMRRAEGTVLGTRRYAELSWQLLDEIRQRGDTARHPLLAGQPAAASPHPPASDREAIRAGRDPIQTSAILVVSGNRGLVGGFHEHIVSRALTLITNETRPPLVVTTGKVVRDILHRRGVAIHADFPKKDLLASPEDAAPIARMLLSAFLEGTCDRVLMVYVDFRSVMRQDVQVRTLLPIGMPDADLGMTSRGEKHSEVRSSSGAAVEYLFEPSPSAVLEAIVPNLLSIQVYQALLETTASEHAARMVAMRAATENAGEIQDDLTLAFNEVRKAGITQEILEIVAGQRSMNR